MVPFGELLAKGSLFVRVQLEMRLAFQVGKDAVGGDFSCAHHFLAAAVVVSEICFYFGEGGGVRLRDGF